MKKQLFTLALGLLVFLAATAQQENYSKVRIFLNDNNITRLAVTGIAVEEGVYKKGAYLETDLSQSEVQKIAEAGFQYQILIEDVSAFYAQRAAESLPAANRDQDEEWPQPEHWEYGSMGGFYTLDQAMAELDEMYSLYPNLISERTAISDDTVTHDGRKIYWVKISDNPNVDEPEPEVLYTGLHHAREPMSIQQMIWYMWYLLENYDSDSEIKQLVDETEMYFVPVINPDGYEFNRSNYPNGGGMWRKNRRDNGAGIYGVDPNRNYGFKWGLDNNGSSPYPSDETYRGPSAFSEPEIKNIRDFCNSHDFQITLNYHSYSALLLYVWGWTEDPSPDEQLLSEYSQLMTRENGYVYGAGSSTIYATNGGSDDWMYGEQNSKGKIMSFTPEVGNGGDGFWPPVSRIVPLCREQMWQNIHAARLAGKYAKLSDNSPMVISETSGYFRFEIKRLGMTPADTFKVMITPLDNNILEVGDARNFINMDLLQTEVDSISFVLRSNIESGTNFRYLLSVDNGDYTVSDTIEKIYGAEVEVFVDDAEDMENWTTDRWALTNNDYHSPLYSFTDSPYGNYQDNLVNPITLDTTIDLTTASIAFLKFWATWEIEAGWDYVQVEIKSVDNGSWTPLEGKYTRAGSGQFQPPGEPIYDGVSDWVKEEIDISDYCGQQVVLRFVLHSDQAVNEDGFYFDDLSVSVVTNTVGIGPGQEAEVAQLSISDAFPNPSDEWFKVSYKLPDNNRNAVLYLYNTWGNRVKEMEVPGNEGVLNISTTDLPAGIYFYRLESAGRFSETKRVVIQ